MMKHERMYILRNSNKENLALHLTQLLRKQQKVDIANINNPVTAVSVQEYVTNYFHLKENPLIAHF
jgi:hypothetical protein